MQTPSTTVPVISREGFITDPFFIAAKETLEKCLVHLSQKHQELQGQWCCNCPYHAVQRLGNWAPAVFIPCILCYPNQDQSPAKSPITPQPCPMEQLRHVIQDPALSTPPAQLSFTSSNFELLLDMHNFLPHEIRVDIRDNLVEVGAQHQELNDHANSISILKRYQLPCPVNNDFVQCSLSKEGILLLTAPWKTTNIVAE